MYVHRLDEKRIERRFTILLLPLIFSSVSMKRGLKGLYALARLLYCSQVSMKRGLKVVAEKVSFCSRPSRLDEKRIESYA